MRRIATGGLDANLYVLVDTTNIYESDKTVGRGASPTGDGGGS